MTTMNDQDYKTITYPIPHDDEKGDGGTLLLLGNPKASRLVLMCGGWPDDAQSCFLPLARRMVRHSNSSTTTTFLIGIMNFPAYDAVRRKEGYTFDEVVLCVGEAIRVLRTQSKRPYAKLTGIFHDVGCIVGTIYANQTLRRNASRLQGLQTGKLRNDVLNELVLLDNCPPPSHHRYSTTTNNDTTGRNHLKVERCFVDTIFTWLGIMTFHVNMALAFLIWRYVNPDIAVLQYLAGYYVTERWLMLFPYTSCTNVDLTQLTCRFEAVDMHHLMYMMYPSYYYCRAKLRPCLFWKRTRDKNELRDYHLPYNLQQTPVLFMYGEEKNIMFHGPTADAVLQEEFMSCRKSKVVCVRNAGHWLHLQQEDVCYNEIIKFLNNSCVRFSPIKKVPKFSN